MRCVFGCLLSLIERGCGPFYCAISPKQQADNVRKVEAAARSEGSQWKVHGPNICFSVSLKGNDDD